MKNVCLIENIVADGNIKTGGNIGTDNDFFRSTRLRLAASLAFVGAASTFQSEATQPLYLCSVSAGFPSPADDYVEEQLNLHSYLVHNPAATFFLRAQGDSMLNAGIHDGDLLIVDRSLAAEHKRVVIVALDGELMVKRLIRRGRQVLLVPENPDYAEVDITEREHVHIWGVVSYVIHKL